MLGQVLKAAMGDKAAQESTGKIVVEVLKTINETNKLTKENNELLKQLIKKEAR